ncbi:hypothetical protein SUGI_0937180 [Cryptomeria japonica]|nr:hypothetical protein SUGI_0937180 [Cryptomeria japonica]
MPPRGWEELNFDGASKGNPRKSGIGAIIQEESGKIISRMFNDIDITTNNEAEIRALEAGLRLCTQNKIHQLIIEGDSQLIINGVTKSNFHNWRVKNWLPSINEHLKTINNYKIAHVYQEGNQVADYLANMGIGKRDGPVFFNHLLAGNDITLLCTKDYCESTGQGIG